MSARHPYAKHRLFILFFCLAALASRADTLTLPQAAGRPVHLSLRPWLTGWEDSAGHAKAAGVLHHPALFRPLAMLPRENPTSVYWLKTTITGAGSPNREWVLSFSHLTWVDAFLFYGDSCVAHQRTGAFRPQSLINEGDGRFHARLPLQPGKTYTLLLKVHHTKGYQPFFDFSLRDGRSFHSATLRRQQVDAGMQGAIGIFFLYILLSWLVSRYRPYQWLLLFTGGVGMYGICSGPYFIDWFFPEDPATGWLFNGPFLHLGLLGFYGLVTDFWNLPQYNPLLNRFGRLCIAVLVAVSAGGFCINYFTGNFNLVNTINLWAFLFPFSFVLALLACCYRRLNRPQKYLYYGIVLFLAGSLYVTLSAVFLREQALLTAPYVTNATILAVFLVFATGLKEALRQHEKDKLAVLQELTHIQQHQNTLLEQQVTDRTGALRQVNEQLQAQTALLVRRNATIETLMNELNHRVKNNLQLLYSLSSLQLPGVGDEKTAALLKGNMARVKAMMLVNQKLDEVRETRQVKLATLVGELTGHLQEIYDRSKNTSIRQDIPGHIELPSRYVLSLGLIVTELVTNSFKYAFGGRKDPCIFLTVMPGTNGHLHMVYADNGKGINKGEQNNASMGLLLVKDLARQLNGTLTVTGEQGTMYTLVIPVGQN